MLVSDNWLFWTMKLGIDGSEILEKSMLNGEASKTEEECTSSASVGRADFGRTGETKTAAGLGEGRAGATSTVLAGTIFLVSAWTGGIALEARTRL